MQFELSCRKVTTQPAPDVEPRTCEFWAWTLTTKEGELARAPMDFASEAQARSNIAAMRKAAGGMKFAKVQDAPTLTVEES